MENTPTITKKDISAFETMLDNFYIVGKIEEDPEWVSGSQDGRKLTKKEKVLALHFRALGKIERNF